MATDVEAIDDFLVRTKYLKGNPPEWKKSNRLWEYSMQWPIVDDLGIEVGELRFKLPRGSNASDSVSVIYRNNPIWRIDLAAKDDCEPNPPDAAAFSLPPFVCGPHEHSWQDNRNFVAEVGFGELIYRRGIPPQIRRFEQILPWLAEKINLTLTHEQRRFDRPAQRDLFRVDQEMQ